MFNKIKKIPGEVLSTFFYVGNIKYAPGTFGSLAALPIVFVLIKYFPLWLLFVFVILVTACGFYSTKIYLKAKNSEKEDPSEVVVDEVAGQSLGLLFHLALINFVLHFKFEQFKINNLELNLPIFFLFNFAFFRFFDIAKIFPVSYFDNKKGAFYVMADDIMAGFLSGLVSFFVYYFLYQR